MSTPIARESIPDSISRLRSVSSGRTSAIVSVGTRLLLPVLPAVVLLLQIRMSAVNVPVDGDWDIIPVGLRLSDGPLSWSRLLAEHLGPAKTAAVWLALATKFNVTAGMYAGFG